MAKKCAVAINPGITYSCVGVFQTFKGLYALKKNLK